MQTHRYLKCTSYKLKRLTTCPMEHLTTHKIKELAFHPRMVTTNEKLASGDLAVSMIPSPTRRLLVVAWLGWIRMTIAHHHPRGLTSEMNE